jgi:aquaporin NIP
MKKYLAEFIGTFALVFCGTGAIIINEHTGGAITHVGIAATFGLVILAMIYAFGEVSGAHFNPAVTIGFWIAKRFDNKEFIPYVGAQLLGAFTASFILKMLFPDNLTLGTNMPAGSDIQSLVLEIILTFLLMMVILQVSQGSKEIGVMAGIAVGATIGLEAMFAGPISGASMNPARSIAPAIITGNISALWVYIIAPITGAVLASFTWRFLKTA